VGLSNEIAVTLKRRADHAPSVQLLPVRRKQTLDVLTIRANDQRLRVDEEGERGAGVLDDESNLRQEIIKINENLYRQRNANTFPLDALISMGLLSSQTPSVESRQGALATQYADSVTFMRDQLKQLCRLPTTANNNSAITPPPQSPTTTTAIVLSQEVTRKHRSSSSSTTGDGDDDECPSSSPLAATVKMSHMFGQFNFTCTNLRRASNSYTKFIKPIYDSEKSRITREFFIDDNLEEDVPPGSVPRRFKIFERLTECNLAKYRGLEDAMREASEKVARPVLEVVSRAHIRTYRYRPRPGDQLCFNGTRCYFYTFSSDPAIRYVGKVFRTPKQLELLNGGGQLPESTDHLLCIDCLLAGWTKRHADNLAKERAPSMATNHFTVLVGKGEYSEACMLHKVFNKLISGFVGNVPFYHENHRANDSVTLHHLGQQAAVTESYIAEIGMDF
jgi:hypothetical protein